GHPTSTTHHQTKTSAAAVRNIDVPEDWWRRRGDHELHLPGGVGVEAVKVTVDYRFCAENRGVGQTASVGEQNVIGGGEAGGIRDVERAPQIQIAGNHNGGVVRPQRKVYRFVVGESQIAGVGQHTPAQRDGVGAKRVGAGHGSAGVVKRQRVVGVAAHPVEGDGAGRGHSVADGDVGVPKGEGLAAAGGDCRIQKLDALSVVDVKGFRSGDVDMAHDDVGGGQFRSSPNDARNSAAAYGRGQVADGDVAPNRGRAVDGADSFPGSGRGGDAGGRSDFVIVAVNGDRPIFDIGHAEVEIIQVLHHAAAVGVGLHANAIIRSVERAVDDGQVRYAHGNTAGDGNAVPGAKSAIGDEQIVDGAGRAHGDVVVANADVAILNHAIGADEIKPVGVGRGIWGVLGQIADGDVAAVVPQAAMMIRRVLESDVVNEKPVGGVQVEHHGADQVWVGIKRRPPGGALTVNPAPAADCQVMNIIAIDEGLCVGGTARISPIGQHLEHRVGVHLQIDAAEQGDGAAQERARRNLDDAATRRVRRVDGVLNVGCVILRPVADGTVSRDIENSGGNGRHRRIGGAHPTGQSQEG